MSEFKLTVEGGASVRLKTAGKYCDRDIVVTASGGGAQAIEEKDITFIDYDGTILHTYAFADAEALTNLPALPSHNGLICQGWNWDLADVKAYAEHRQKMHVGAMYITDDGKTRVYITLLSNALSPQVRFATTGTVLIDWGDGSTTTVTGTSASTTKTTTHDYAAAGDYVITYEVLNGAMYLLSSSSAGGYLMHSATSSQRRNYQYAIRKIELGANVFCNASYAFAYFSRLETITLPDGLETLGTGVFNYCYLLKSIVVPKTVSAGISIREGWSVKRVSLPKAITEIDASGFRDSSLDCVFLPDGLQSIGTYAFYRSRLKNVVIPKSVETMGTFAFSACYMLGTVTVKNGSCAIPADAFANCYFVHLFDFTECESVPTLESTDAFENVSPLCEFRVPASLYDEWVAATNWSSFASQIRAVDE